MKKVISVLLILLVTLTALPVTAAAMTSLERQACTLVNAQRTARGLSPLEISSSLSDKARIKSQDMAQGGYFSHTSPTYGSPFTMMRTLGMPAVTPPWESAMRTATGHSGSSAKGYQISQTST